MYRCALIFWFFSFFNSFWIFSFCYSLLFFSPFQLLLILLFFSLLILIVLFFVFLIFSSYILTVVLQTRTLMIYTFPSFWWLFRGGQPAKPFDPFGAKLMYITVRPWSYLILFYSFLFFSSYIFLFFSTVLYSSSSYYSLLNLNYLTCIINTLGKGIYING